MHHHRNIQIAVSVVGIILGVLFLGAFGAPHEEGGPQTPLMKAAYAGDIAAMRRLLAQGHSPDQVGSSGLSALYYAAGATRTSLTPRGSGEAVKLLLEHGANANIKSHNGFTVLMAAVNNENVGSAELLVKYGTDVNATTSDGGCALAFAASRLNLEMVKLLLDNNARPNKCRDTNGETPLISAVAAAPSLAPIFALRSNSQEAQAALEKVAPTLVRARMVIKALLAHGADVNVSEQNGNSPLSLAVAQVNHLVVINLLNAGANPNVIDNSQGGASPLIIAVQTRSVLIASELLKHGAKATVRDQFRKSALDYARSYGPPKMVEIIQQSANK